MDNLREQDRSLREFSHIIIFLLMQLSLISNPYSVPKSPHRSLPRNKSSVSIVLLKKVRVKGFMREIFLFVISGLKLTNLIKE